MPDTKTLPEQIVETSHAFTQSLEMENAVFQGQLNGIVKMTIDALQKLIVLCRDANSLGEDHLAGSHLGDLKQQALDHLQQAVAQTGKTAAPSLSDAATADTGRQDLDSAAVQAVSLSYKNAVNAQQQVYITQQAATTMLITTLISTVTATVGNAVRESAVA